ncbi:diguanylate cyclase [Miltoncostaea oceani]|uniref:diguanylate cyclase n=1 Tax=Miltoncostaea oceani TaxID=2843216 RepID=UPI001C3C95BC|nr:diguanylate cyclase [Miltoncostaea oceani]
MEAQPFDVFRALAEQAALHRVASAVAESISPVALYDLVAEEVAGLLGVEAGIVWRFEGMTSEAVGSWGDHLTIVGSRFPLRGHGVLPRIWATNRPARALYDEIPADDPTRARIGPEGYRAGVGAPIRTSGGIWGAVLAATTRPDGLPEGAEERLGRFAELVGLAIVNSEDRRALADRVAEQTALGRVAAAVAAEWPPDEVFTLVCHEAARLTGAVGGCVIQLLGPDEGLMRTAWTDGGTSPLAVGSRIPLAPRSGELPAAAGEALRSAPTAGGPDWRLGWGDAVTCPIMIAGVRWGILSVAAAAGGSLPPGAEARLTRLAELAGVAVANAESRREIARHAAEQAALRRVATAVAADAEPEEVFALVSREAADLLGAASGLVIHVDARRAMHLVGGWRRPGLPAPPDGLSVPMADTETARALHGGRPVRVPLGHLDTGPWREAYGESVAAPIGVHGRLWGILCVSPVGGERIAADEDERLLAFAHLVGVSILNAENRAATAQEAREQAALRRVATAVAATADLDEVFALICREAAALLDVPSAGVMRFLDERRSQVVANWTAEGMPAPAPGAIIDMEARPAAAGDLRAGRAAHFAPDEASPSWTRAFDDVVAAPIVLGGELWGTLGVAGVDGPLGVAIEARLARFADLAGIAVANEEARRRSVDEAAALISGGALDMPSTLQAIARSARRALYADRVTCIVAAEGDTPTDVFTTEEDPAVRAEIERALREEPVAALMWSRMREGRDPITEMEDAGAAVEAATGVRSPLTMASSISIRLRAGEEVLGTIVASYRVPRRFTPRDRATLRSLASVAELAVVNARRHALTLAHLADAEERAATDPLTGLVNHRVFHERLREEVERSRRHRRPLSLVVFDLDHFKDVNDRHGHQAGDEILVAVGECLGAQARPEDVVARLGGEEFAWLVAESDSLDAWQAAERVREAVRRLPVAGGERLTLSAGVAELSQASDAGDLLRLADGALYWAKGHGRDISFRYSPEVVEELSAQERADRLERSQALNAIRVLARAVDAKDPSTRRHSERVSELADQIAGELGWPAERRALLRGAGLVHDVGKIGVPDSILFKPGRLTSGEYEQVKQHARLGAQIVADVLSAEQVVWVRHHHERIDGAGYPDGLAGDDIPEGSRVLAVADAWDVMTSDRPYAPPITAEAALQECHRVAGSQFSPDVVDALARLVASGATRAAELI